MSPLLTGGAAGACDGALALDFLQRATADPTALGMPLAGGEVFNVHAWYRDPPAPKPTNLTNAVQFTLAP